MVLLFVVPAKDLRLLVDIIEEGRGRRWERAVVVRGWVLE
jgi:hypothetical protein